MGIAIDLTGLRSDEVGGLFDVLDEELTAEARIHPSIASRVVLRPRSVEGCGHELTR